MKKITVVCLKSDQDSSLEALRDFGAMHVKQTRKYQSEKLSEITAEKEKLEQVINTLSASRAEDEPERSFAEYDEMSLEQLLEACWDAIHNITWYEENIVNHERMHELLEPWGEFDGKLVEDLRAKGLDVRFCTAREADLPKLPENLCMQVVRKDKEQVYFLVIATEPITIELPEMHVHTETSLKELEERTTDCHKAIARFRGQLQSLSNYLPKLEEEVVTLEEREEFIANRDGMGEESELVYVEGYVPSKAEEELKQFSLKHGWAYQVEDADLADDDVPVALNPPKIFNISKPIFKFLGIMPGYDENDVSVSVLLFLTLFFGMIVGDAAYGTIFLVISLIARAKCKTPGSKTVASLFILMSITTVIWGALTGNYFAIKMPEGSFWAGLDYWKWLPDDMIKDALAMDPGKVRDDAVKVLQNKAIQYFCFIIAGIHLGLGRLWRAFTAIVLKKPLVGVGHIGWALFLWGNFFIATQMIVGIEPPMNVHFYLLSVGAALILIFGVNWKDVGEVLNMPFGFIGAFVDVLSYIRLFAVGLSSYFIAFSFNGMAMDLYEASPWLLPFTILILFFGHLLNIALCIMGVLVHGVRLNTLEFSNHMELTWRGRFYRPFKKKNTEVATPQ